MQINSSSPLAFLELIHSPLLLLSPPRKKSRTLESSLSVPTIRPTQEGLQHPPESIIHQIYASRTGTLAPIDPNTEWVKKQILLGTRSLPKMAAQVQKMQKYCKLRDISDMQLPDFYRYLHFASTTCLPQSVAGYASTIKNAALRLGLAWASDPIVPLLIRGIRSQATPPEGANPMTVDNFHLLLRALSRENNLSSKVVFLAGQRLDEVFRVTKPMITFIRCSLSGGTRDIDLS